MSRNKFLALSVLLVLAGGVSWMAAPLAWSPPALACRLSSDARGCLLRLVERQLDAEGPEAAMHAFASLAAVHGPAFAASPGACHIAAHAIGERAFGRYALAEAGFESPEEGIAACDWGYPHAYLEALFESAPDINKAEVICERVGAARDDAPALRAVCYSSAGSGVVRAALLHAPVPALEGSLPLLQEAREACGTLAEADAGRACLGGAFGELLYRVTASSTARTYSAGDFTALCARFAGESRLACMSKAAAALFLVPHFDMEMLASFVKNSGDSSERAAPLASGLSLFFLNPARPPTPAQLFTACSAAVGAEECAAGIVGALFIARSDTAAYEAADFCGVPEVPTESCYDAFADNLRQIYSTGRAENLCAAAVPEAYRYLCAFK